MSEEKNTDSEWLEHWSGWWELEYRKVWDQFLKFQGIPDEAQEAATKTVDRHHYQMTKDTFSMRHTIPAKEFDLEYSAPIDWEWHECPYPKPTAKLYGAGHSAQAAEKTQWRHRWTTFPRCFETEIQCFIEGKNVRMVRELASPSEMRFTVSVLETEGADSVVLVGPCLTGFRKDGEIVGQMKITAKKGAGFYLKAAQAFLQGVPVSGGEYRRQIPKIELDAIGNAINNAISVATTLEAKDIGVICRVRSDQQDLQGKHVPAMTIQVRRKDASILPLVAVSPYSILGSRMSMTGTVLSVADEPGPDTAFVDPAGLHHIQYSPGGAGGAAGQIYKWLGIRDDPEFPAPVREAIQAPLQAKFHAYGEKKCIHVVGPNFNDHEVTREEAVGELAQAYQNVLAEFAGSGLRALRMLPISGSIFAGQYLPQIHQMTPEALHQGFAALTSDQQQKVLDADRLEMCIFMEKEVKDYAQAFSKERAA